MKKFKGKKNNSLLIPLLVILAIVSIVIYFDHTVHDRYYILLPIITPAFIILWKYFGTVYKINDQKLYFRSGLNSGSLNISDIKEIHKSQSTWHKFMSSHKEKGLIIRYNKYDQIYVTPQDCDEIINELINMNNSISIIDKQKANIGYSK